MLDRRFVLCLPFSETTRSVMEIILFGAFIVGGKCAQKRFHSKMKLTTSNSGKIKTRENVKIYVKHKQTKKLKYLRMR